MPDIPEGSADPHAGEGKAAELKIAVLRLAARIAAAADPLSVTFGAATRVLKIHLIAQDQPKFGRHEDIEAVSDLIDSLRRIVLAHPDSAASYVRALQSVCRAHARLIDPAEWIPSPEQMARARDVLREEGDVFDIKFDKDGRLIARAIGGEFVEIVGAGSPPVLVADAPGTADEMTISDGGLVR